MDQMKDEQGSVLVEVLVSAILLTVAAIGVFSAFDAASRSSAQERHRAQAHGLAQSDLARLRTMRISQLSPFLAETRTLTVDETPYTVKSEADFISDATGTDTCDEENASADYIRIRSTVTWPSKGERAAVVSTSLVAPPNSTAKAKSGALIIEVVDGKNDPRPGVPLAGSGPTPFSRETGANGCAVFGNLLAGAYTVTATVPGMVNPEGDESGVKATSVVAEATSPLLLEYDVPGSLIAHLVTRPKSAAETPRTAGAQAISVYHSRLDEARAFKAKSGFQSEIEAPSLFPFDSPYSVYAGVCESNNPDPTGEHPSAAITEVEVSAGGEAAKTEVELPALRLKVYKGRESDSTDIPAAGAKVTIKDSNCTSGGLSTLKYTTNVDGELDEPGLPFSRKVGSSGGYTICVSGPSTSTTSSKRKETFSNVSVPAAADNIAGGTELIVYLRDEDTTTTDCWS
jgi:Tfp pilus assembly protein PilV